MTLSKEKYIRMWILRVIVLTVSVCFGVFWVSTVVIEGRKLGGFDRYLHKK